MTGIIPPRLTVNIRYRQGRENGCRELAELISLSSGGVVDYLYQDLIPGESAVEVIAGTLKKDIYPITYRNTIVAEYDHETAGMALSFPSRFHGVNPETASLLPRDRFEHMRDFYHARVDGSWYIDSLGVFERFRRKGIGKRLIELTQEHAVKQGYRVVSLIVFADNTPALELYRSLGFQVQRHVDLQGNDLIPHFGGCLLLCHDLCHDMCVHR